jgi:protein tyrosine phosphatase (PTP) superfamily phosphohydrolase (DUF442 family)
MKINQPILFLINFFKLSIGNILKINLMGRSIEDIYNFVQLSDRIATAGQPTVDQYPAIATGGYEIVINLALKESANALPDEDAIAANLGLEYIHIPVLWEAPTLENFQEFANVINVHSDQKIFVHCAANMRVSAFMYLYRQLYNRVDEETARLDLEKIWQPNQIWQNFIDRVARCPELVEGSALPRNID